jgi:hypothetical protein
MAADLPLTTGQTVRRAWLALSAAFVVFGAALTSLGAGAYIYHRSAMQQREATLQTTGEALLQPKNETRFKQVRAGEPVREGDRIKAQNGVQARLVFFDGAELQLAEGALVLVDELQSSRFVNDEKRIRLVQEQGWSRLVAAPASDFKLGRYSMQMEGLEVEARSQPGRGAELSFELRPAAEAPSEPGQVAPQEARVAVYRGEAQARAGSDSVTLVQGQATTFVRGGHVTPPAAMPNDFIRNGSFQDLVTRDRERDLWPQWWRETRDQGGDGGERWGSAEVTRLDIDGRAGPMIRIERRLNATDNAVHGIQQQLDLPLSHFRELRLRVTFQVIYHSLSGGGVEDSEYPIIIKVTYRDRQNRSIAWYRGFYTHNESGFRTPNGELVEQGQWIPFSKDLLKLNLKPNDPEPVFLETLDIYASGHDFEAVIASVSIEGQ